MYCGNCGNKVTGRGRYCSVCGELLEPLGNVANQGSGKKKNSSKKYVIVIIILVAIIVAITASIVSFVSYGILSEPIHTKFDNKDDNIQNNAAVEDTTENDIDVEFVSSNVTSYPQISVYFKIKDMQGHTVEGLGTKDFRRKEGIGVDEYLERDVIEGMKVGGNEALNVSLAIDKSGSIDEAEMRLIKNATNTFLTKLQYQSGDKAEIIAFDTFVMQLCSFTGDESYLHNGVNSMNPYDDRRTACYDAIARAINHVSYQDGARCAIIFTDGEDNESRSYNPQSVIALANDKNVPVYIIGVGDDVDRYTLENIATSTGGTYHHINDIEDMGQVYDEIYKEQQDLYVIKYVSDRNRAYNEERAIMLDVKGNGHKGRCEARYTPITPIQTRANGSRYEVVKSDISWEDASVECELKGGHLATITSRAEEEQIIELARAKGVEKLWIGAQVLNGYNGEGVGHWITGEEWSYQNWHYDSKNNKSEPSRFDTNGDGVEEFYVMLWYVNGAWSWNDQRNDLVSSKYAKQYVGKMGYVIEYEN